MDGSEKWYITIEKWVLKGEIRGKVCAEKKSRVKKRKKREK